MTNKALSTLDVLNKTSLQNLCRERRLATTGTKETLKNSPKNWMTENGVSSLFPEASAKVQQANGDTSNSLVVDGLVTLWKDVRVWILALRANPDDTSYMALETFQFHARLQMCYYFHTDYKMDCPEEVDQKVTTCQGPSEVTECGAEDAHDFLISISSQWMSPLTSMSLFITAINSWRDKLPAHGK